VVTLSVVALSSNEAILDSIREKQTEALEKQHDKGRISDEQLEQQQEIMELTNSRGVFIGFGVAGGFFVSVLLIILTATALVILSRMLGRDNSPGMGFATAMAATAIAFMISNVESVLTTVGMFLTSDMEFRISPSAFLDIDNSILTYVVNLLNPFTIWVWFVLGTAIAMFARTDRLKATLALAGLWTVVGIAVTGIFALFGSMFGA
jgi:hypothetical protein